MDYCQHKLDIGELQGIKISEEITVCMRLFADDLGVFIAASERNFRKLQEIISVYEAASGARMNLAKTVIIPLGFTDVPQCVHDTGSNISAPGDVQRFLGAPIEYQLRIADLHNFCLDKIGKRISGWSNHLPSFTGKVILIQHIL